MSRVGKKPITIPSGVTVSINDRRIGSKRTERNFDKPDSERC